MIEPIEESNFGEAVGLLAEGFPRRSRAYWAGALERIDALGENRALGIPFGHIMRTDGRAQGVALTIASRRPDHGERERVHVNYAAWYVAPDQRWRAPLMMRALIRTPCDVFTDLTPSTAVRAILPSFGFKQITQGIVLDIAALHQGGGEVLDLGAVPTQTRALLSTHARFGGQAVALRSRDGALTPILYKIVKWRGLRAAQILYCASNRLLHGHLGALAKHLRREGIGLIKLDASVDGPPPRGWLRKGRELRFVRGPTRPDVTDYLGSELSLFDW